MTKTTTENELVVCPNLFGYDFIKEYYEGGSKCIATMAGK